MKRREKIMGISDKSNERMVREIWYFSEESVKSFSPKQEEVDSGKLDGYKQIIKGKYENFTPKSIGKSNLNREVPFVVDWQLSDSL